MAYLGYRKLTDFVEHPHALVPNGWTASVLGVGTRDGAASHTIEYVEVDNMDVGGLTHDQQVAGKHQR